MYDELTEVYNPRPLDLVMVLLLQHFLQRANASGVHKRANKGKCVQCLVEHVDEMRNSKNSLHTAH